MSWKKQKGWWASMGVALVALAGAVVLLLRWQRVYTRVNGELEAQAARLRQLQQRDPFPSETNVERAQQNLAALQTFFSNQTAALRAHQVTPAKMERAEFQFLLERTVRGLRERAAAPGATVKLPERFGFGFDRYLLGDLPAPEDIPRLVVQLRIVERLCRLLFEARVSELLEIKRAMFEKPRGPSREVEAETGRRLRRVAESAAPPEEEPIPEVEEGGLLSRERFEIRFTASEAAVWELLQKLATDKTFALVAELELKSVSDVKAAVASPSQTAGSGPTPQVAPSVPGPWPVGPAALVAPRPKTHDERVVAGRERVQVRMVVDVYRFDVGGTEGVGS